MNSSRKLINLFFINILWLPIIFGKNQTAQFLPLSKSYFPIENHEKPTDASLFKQTGSVNGTGTGSVTEVKQGRCQCSNGVCGCCSRFLFDTLGQKACFNVTYDPDEFSFTAKLWLNDGVLYTRTVSGKNPRPVCINVPRIPFFGICIRFYNIHFQGRNVHACVNMEGKVQSTILFQVGFDCIRLGANGVALVKPEDGGGLGQVEFFPDNPDETEDDYEDEDEDDDDDDDDDDDYL